MKKSEARGPTPGEKAKKALGEKLNRPFKRPPSLNELRSTRSARDSAPPTRMDVDLSRLEPIARVIARRLAERSEHFITHPSEMKLFGGLTEEQLSEFARRRGWRVVRRVGGRRIEFYNDAAVKMAAARGDLRSR